MEKKAKATTVVLIVLLCISWVIQKPFVAAETFAQNQNTEQNAAVTVSEMDYSMYLKENSAAGWSGSKIVLSGDSYSSIYNS